MITPINFLDGVYSVLRQENITVDFSLLLYYKGDFASWIRSTSPDCIKNAAEGLMNTLNTSEEHCMDGSLDGHRFCAMKWKEGIAVLLLNHSKVNHILQTVITKVET